MLKEAKLKEYRAEKTTRMMRTLESLVNSTDDETLDQVIKVIIDKVEFYDSCLKSWDNPNPRCDNPESINEGRIGCNGGLDMADAIVNELRILYLQ